MAAKNNIGILTGGGDVPGLNPVIKSVVYRAKEMGRPVIGIRKGWEGLTHMASDSIEDPIYIRPLTRDNTRTIDRTGGTVLHTSRTNPRKMLESKIPKHISPDRIKKLPFDGKHYDFTPIVLENLDRLGNRMLRHNRWRRHVELFGGAVGGGDAGHRDPEDDG